MMFLQYLKRHQTFDYFCKSSHREPVWSGVGVKKLPKCFQKLSNSHGSFLHKLIYFKLAQKSPNIWATLASKFCAKNFQKSLSVLLLFPFLFLFYLCRSNSS